MKIVILGAPGSGKSTLAAKLQESLKIPHVRGDELFWRQGQESSAQGFRRRVSEQLSGSDWIFEGHVMKVFDLLAGHAPLLISITESVPRDFVFVVAADLKNYLLGRDPQKARKRLLHHLQSWPAMRAARAELVADYATRSPEKVISWERSRETLEQFLARVALPRR